jgi:glutathione S-transferase
MKLYYSPGSCSLSPHIVLRETGQTFELDRIDNKNKKTSDGRDFLGINPKGYVPVLELDDGQVLTEGAAIVQFLADQRPDAQLAPTPGSFERVRLQEQLNFIASEVHKAFSPLFSPDTTGPARDAAVSKVRRRLGDVERRLSDGRQYLMGDRFSVADVYLFVVASWSRPTKISLEEFPHLEAWMARIAARKSVQDSLVAEGLA